MATVEERLAELEKTVAVQQDKLAIMQVVARYGPVIDAADSLDRMPPVVDMWADGAVADIDKIGRLTFPDEITANFQEFHFPMVPQGLGHVMSSPLIKLEGDKAWVVNYSTIFRPEGDRFYVWRVAANLWELGRVDGEWLVLGRSNRLLNGSDEARAILRNADDFPRQ